MQMKQKVSTHAKDAQEARFVVSSTIAVIQEVTHTQTFVALPNKWESSPALPKVACLKSKKTLTIMVPGLLATKME